MDSDSEHGDSEHGDSQQRDSEQRDSQQESSEVRWHRKLLENIADTVTIVSLDGTTKWTSAVQIDTLGYSGAFWDETNLFDLVHPDDLSTVIRWQEELIQAPNNTIAGELRLRSVDDSYSFVGFHCVNLIDDPDVGGIVIAARSVDEEVKARRLQAKQHANFETQLAGHSSLIADVSHEMRAPIHAMLGLTELLLDDDEMALDQRRDLETVQRQATTLKTMVDELLDLSKLGADRVELQAEPFSATGLTDDVARAFVPLAQAKGLKLSVQIDPTVPLAVIGDEFRVRQILTNLMSNAVKYTDEGSIVLAVGTSPESSIVFSVSDTGRGIPPGMNESIFEPYTQARAGDVATGTGIGLAIARRLARMMEGDLWFDSVVASAGETPKADQQSTTRSEPGTTFSCELPLPVGRRESDHALVARLAERPQESDAVGAPAARASADSPDADRSESGLILVVDDSEVNRMLAESQLSRLGYRSRMADGAAAAFEILASEPIDLVLMDWHMPDVDGLEATRQIRASGSPWADISIVAVTASALVDDRQTCLDAGMDDYLSKPVSLADLEGIVTKWLVTETEVAETPLTEHLDMTVVAGLREDLGSDEIVMSVARTFIDELDRLTGEILRGQSGGDAEVVRHAGHTLKSTAAMLGATRLASASASLEAEARNESPDLNDLIEEFGEASVDARSALVSLVAQLEADEEPTLTNRAAADVGP